MGWIPVSHRIYPVRRKSNGAPEKTIPDYAVYENGGRKRLKKMVDEFQWAAEYASAAKNPKLSKSLNRSWDHWLQTSSQGDPSFYVDTGSTGKTEPVSGNTSVYDQSVLVHIWQSYAAFIKEVVHLSHEKRRLVKPTHESFKDSHEWSHALQSCGEDISLEMLQNSTFELHRKGQKGRWTRNKEWLANARNPSLLSFTSSSLSRSSRTRFSLSPDTPISPLSYHDAPIFELPDSTLAELADTSRVQERQMPLHQPPSPSTESVSQVLSI
ncbi:hypothetical protein ACJ73_07852 [Blastomyces percursus]|uniref:Uncharacterized protein n=1 Tax=Blastomyces percursus TaxID=1658174 RepID=A0A1J9PY22_9EURO|nr:hypothetical protein ACJ73_07852 [Blastomyces percursus]